MLRNNIKYKLVFVCLISFLFSCKKEQPKMSVLEENCECIKEVSANFKMGQFADSPINKVFVETDTIHFYVNYFEGNPDDFNVMQTKVDFVADCKDAISYKWQVGNNAIQQTTKSFSLLFDDTLGTIPVTLIVQAKPNLICNPTDDGIDTITKFLTLKVFDEFPLKGKYEGTSSNNPASKFIIEIDTFMTSSYQIRYGIKNLPNGQHWFNSIGELKTYSFNGISDGLSSINDFYIIYAFNGQNKEDTPTIYDRNTNTIKIKYSYEYRAFSPYSYFNKITFTGKKL